MSMISRQIDELRVVEELLHDTNHHVSAQKVNDAIDTIQALSAKVADQNLNRSEIPNSSDLISRQVVVDEIEKGVWNVSEMIERIESLPSADLQPTCNQLATTERNLINREDAINCIKWGEGVTDVIEQIKSLPSAQEIIRCKECKHRDPEDKKCDSGHSIRWQLPRDDNWFCADAERRTDE